MSDCNQGLLLMKVPDIPETFFQYFKDFSYFEAKMVNKMINISKLFEQ